MDDLKYVDVFMDDGGFYRAECAICRWKTGRCITEGEANEVAEKHDASHDKAERTE